MRDTKSLLLGLLSIVLIGTWIYHLYDKSRYSDFKKVISSEDSLAIIQGVRDSLQRNFTASLNKMDARLDSSVTDADSLKTLLDAKLKEVYRLRNEINLILKNGGSSRHDIALAKEKIKELETLVDDLKTQKLSIEEEKQSLNEKMNSLNGDIAGLQESMNRLSAENKKLSDKLSLASLFVASDIHLNPVTLKNEKEQETSQARKVIKLVVSFNVQNNSTQFENAELYIVIIQPDGTAIKNEDIWENTSTQLYDGKEISFTRKIKFQYEKGESKNLIFSIDAPEYFKGTYTLKIYQNGHLIGQAKKDLK